MYTKPISKVIRPKNKVLESYETGKVFKNYFLVSNLIEKLQNFDQIRD